MPLFWLSLAFLAGLCLTAVLPFPAPYPVLVWGFLAAASLVAWRWRWRFPFTIPILSKLSRQSLPSRLPLPAWLLCLALAAGGIRGAIDAGQSRAPGSLAAYLSNPEMHGKPVVVEGLLVAPPEQASGRLRLVVEVDELHLDGSLQSVEASGRLLALVNSGKDVRYGDRLRLEGQLDRPPAAQPGDSFSYRDYLARQEIYGYMPGAQAVRIGRDQGSPFLAAVYRLHERSVELVHRFYPDPEASLLAGILLGAEDGIPDPMREAFEASGTSHIIAISGYNMALLAGLFTVLFGRLFGRRWGAVTAALAITLYTILVGAAAPVVRAAVMSGIALLGRQVGRRQSGLNSLAFVAAILALVDPDILWDVGFQLSFMATLGLVCYAEPLEQAFRTYAGRWLSTDAVNRAAGPVGEYLLFTLAAQITTLPITVYYFQRLSPVSLVANPFILPAQPAVMILGGLSVVFGLVWQPLGQLAAWLALPFVIYTVRMVEWFASLPGATLALGEVALPVVLLFYAGLFAYPFLKAKWPGLSVQTRPALALSTLAALAVLAWRAVLSAPDGRLHLVFLDVGTGDGILIETPEERHLLVDGGPNPKALSDGLGRRLPVGGRELDWLVVGATGDEQLRALPNLIERFPPRQVLWAGAPAASRGARDLRRELVARQIPITAAEVGQTIGLGREAELEVLAVGRGGAVYLIQWGNFRALLPVGLDFETLEALQDDPSLGPVSVLMLAESGYAPANPPEWIAKLRPQLTVLSVAAGDWQELPSAETLEAVSRFPLLRTDRNGWIHITTDGKQMWVEVERR